MEAVSQLASVPNVALPGKGMKKFKFTWEHGALLLLGGAALISGTMLWFQWKPATIGRRVRGDLVTFLKKHGAQVDGNKISGGPVTIPMTLDDAVVGTIDTIISDINTRAAKRGPAGSVGQAGSAGQGHARTPEIVAAAESAHGAGGAVPRPGRSQGRGQGQGQQQQMMMPAGSAAPQGGKSGFPEPPISGRTGNPIVAPNEPTMQLPQVIGGMTHDSQGETPQGDDFSYQPPIPPGMRPPGAGM